MSLRISVVGCGYLGATHAAGMADLGHSVVGIDADPTKVETLAAGKAPVYEPGLDDLLAKHVAAGNLTFSTDYAEAADADVHFICVGTPQRPDSLAADMSYINSSIDSLAEHLNRPTLVAMKSTVPVGTGELLAARIAEVAPVGTGAEYASNPEFLREGHAIEDTLRPDRFVFGVASDGAEQMLRKVYTEALKVGMPVVVADYPTAELVKVTANAFLATKISFINAIAELSEVAGADVTKVADAIGHDDRIGRKMLNSGIGFGGGCLPKDIRAFMARAGELGVGHALNFLGEVDAINERRRDRVVELALELLGGSILDRRVAVLGAAFKPNSDDVRDSPALTIAGQLHLHGAKVAVYDPQAMDNARRIFPTLEYASTAAAACRDADIVLHLTEWQEFRELDPEKLGEAVANRVVIDGRNCLDKDAWRAAGWSYHGLGRP